MMALLFKNIRPKEKDITREIRNYLKIMGVFHFKVHQGLGSVPGVPDIIGIWKGRPLFIEVKAEKGYLSVQQDNFLKSVRNEGGIAFVARSVDDVIIALKRIQEVENGKS